MLRRVDAVRRLVRIDAQWALCVAGVTWFRGYCQALGISGAAFVDPYTLVGAYVAEVLAIWATRKDPSADPVLLFCRRGSP